MGTGRKADAMAMPVVWPSNLITLTEFDALPESETRVELQEGLLVMSPGPVSGHQRAVLELYVQLREQLPGGSEALIECEVLVYAEPLATVRVPDLVITPVLPSRLRFQVSDVRLAVEVLSPGSRGVDRVLKRHEYAEAGIPHYWTVDLESQGAPEVTVFELQSPGDPYTQMQVATGEVVVERPFPLRIDLAALAGSRG